jgi:ATP-dependent helicase HepA
MSGFPKRKAHLLAIPLQDKKERWLERLSNEFSADRNTTEEQKFWFSADPRVDRLLDLMEELSPKKVLLICRTKEKVLALDKAISKRAAFKVGMFHEDLTIVQRDRNAAWFAEPDGARLLICSEIGSEGRNFQFAHHLVLFDLPLHPELLEQRIGRLDRIGQTEDIQIHVPFVEGSAQEVLVKWFHSGLNAFEENIEGGNKISGLFADRLMETIAAPTQLDSLINDTKAYQLELKKTLANGRDRLLEMNSFRPKVANTIVEKIQKQDQDLSLEIYMTRVFEHFSIEMEDLAARTYLLHPTLTNDIAFPSVPEEGVAVTFDRKKALSREDMSFISWDHPMVTGAIDMVLSEGVGGASYAVYRGANSPGMLMEVLLVLETAGGKGLHVDRFLPNTPLRVVVDHSGNDVTDKFPVDKFDQKLIPGQIDDLLENETIVEGILPNMMSAANEHAQELGEAVMNTALRKMNATLDHEVSRLKTLQERNNEIRPAEIEIAEKEQATLSALIQEARVRLDALMLVRLGEDLF